MRYVPTTTRFHKINAKYINNIGIQFCAQANKLMSSSIQEYAAKEYKCADMGMGWG